MREKGVPLGEKPQINLSRCSTAGRMWLVSLCAGLTIIQSALTDSFASLGLALAVLFAAVLTEALIRHWARQPFSLWDGSAVASALILAILLPNRLPPVYAVLGSVFAMAVVKHSFGGLGSNWLNPAAGGWLFVRFSWPEAFRGALAAVPLGPPPENSGLSFPLVPNSAADTLIRSFLNRTIFSVTGSELPGGYIDLFMSSAGGIIADRGIGALLLGTLIITASQVNRSWIPALYLGLYGLLIRLFGALPGSWGQGDLLFGFLSGGTLAAAFILAGDPATSPKSNLGILLVTSAAAFFSYLFRYVFGEPYGAFLAILLLNALVPLIRDFESRRFYGKRRPA